MQLFLKILNGKANSVDPDQTAPSGLIWVCTVCTRHIEQNFTEMKKIEVSNFQGQTS